MKFDFGGLRVNAYVFGCLRGIDEFCLI